MRGHTALSEPGAEEIPVTRTVLLEHTTPGGGVHLDWLIERPHSDREHRLIAFRCVHDPTTRASWTGERIADHRAHYLEYQGPIAGNRGAVRRVWSKRCVVYQESADRIKLTIGKEPPLVFTGAPVGDAGGRWVFGIV